MSKVCYQFADNILVVNTQGYSEVGFASRLSSGFIHTECAILIKTLLKEFAGAKRFLEKIMRLPKAFNVDTVAKAAGEIASLHQSNPIDYRRWLTPEEPIIAPTFEPSTLKSSHHSEFAI